MSTSTFRVIVTGSRQLADHRPVWDALYRLVAEHGHLTVVHGGCPNGADRYASLWASDNACATEVIYPADWDRHGIAAGPIRNRAMVADGADLVLAFPQLGGKNRGTRHCVRTAHAAELPVNIYGPEGVL
jgi:hypothetical protein